MQSRNWILGLLLVAIAVTTLVPDNAGAIPAFARRYKISCTTCHAPFPRLTSFGAEFAGNAFTIPEQDKPRDYVSAGDDLLELNRTFPLAVRFDAFSIYGDQVSGRGDFQTPWIVKLLSGGSVAKNIGYYFYFYLTEGGDLAGIEDAYLHFNDIGGSALDIMVGQFQVSDPLMKRELRLTYEDYEIYRTRVGLSRINLTYDRGFMLPYSIESTKTDLVLIAVNGNGLEKSGSRSMYDNDGFKSYAGRILQGIGQVADIGLFGYWGKEKIAEAVIVPSVVPGATNEVTYWGPDLWLYFGPVQITVQYMWRQDTDPDFDDVQNDVETDGWIGQLNWAISGRDLSRHWLSLLYNRVDSGCDLVGKFETLTAGYTFVLQRNVRLTAEYTRNLEFDANRLALGVVSAF